MRRRGARWGTTTAVALALTLTGCAGGTSDDGASAVGADGEGTGSGASQLSDAMLGIIEAGVDVADDPAAVDEATFRSGEDGEGLAIGDLVRTDEAGFAEVAWFDGALARVDVDTLYALVELDATVGSATVVTQLDVGRIWNRLREDVVTTYEVRTDVGVAAVRGTGFWVECLVEGCTFAVLEGTVSVTALDETEVVLEAGQQVTVDDEGTPGAPTPADFNDPWVVRNGDLDEERGFAPLEPPADAQAGGCPFDGPPEGWVEEPATEGPAAVWCRFVDPNADNGRQFALIEWHAVADGQVRVTIDQNRPFFDQYRDEIAASDCADGAREEFVTYEEPLGSGELFGYAWRVARGHFSGGSCVDGVANAFHSVVAGGQVFVLRPFEGPIGCTISDAGATSSSDWAAHVDCLFGAFDETQAGYRALASELLGG